ncbi:MAG: hypothetical protein AB1898_32280 [Acidobacteriota bacterium]
MPDVKDEYCYALGVHCAWRITREGVILAGLDDYVLPSDDNREDMPAGYLQEKKLADLLGEIKEGEIVNTGSGFIAESVDADNCGGIRINFTGGYALEVFPTSSDEMAWDLMYHDGGSLGWMNGKGYKTDKWVKAENAQPET